MVAEAEGKIVGYQFVVLVPHLEPIWIAEPYRSSMLAVRLFTSATAILDDLRITIAYCFSKTDKIAGYLSRLGLKDLSYKVFVYDPLNKYPKE